MTAEFFRRLDDPAVRREVERLRLALAAIRNGRQTERWRRRAAEIEDLLMEVVDRARRGRFDA
jgi:hypothetical protein